MEWIERMRDAAFPKNIDPSWTGAIGGYYGSSRALNVWDPNDWPRFKRNRKLPIWVAGSNGEAEGKTAAEILRLLGVPAHAWTAVDMETRVNKQYLEHFSEHVQGAGYRIWVYGSASTVFHNPPLDGYWVADYKGIGPFMYETVTGIEVRSTQYQPGELFDSSTVKPYTYDHGIWWR